MGAVTQVLSNSIGASAAPARSGRILDVVEPATGKVYTSVPASGPEDVNAAVQAAQEAQAGWQALGAQGRSDCLRRLANLLHNNLLPLAEAESRDTGKPVQLAVRMDMGRAVDNLRFFADAITQASSQAHATDDAAINYTLRKPLGVVGCISPWNLPLYLLTWKIAPALAAGNTVVAKPSEITPYTASLLADFSTAAGMPPGVLNIVHGLGAEVGPALVTHPQVAAVSFTGSTRTGADIAGRAAPLFKKLSLEMGGKNPSVIFADADFEAAVSQTLRAAFTNQGQVCLCGSRIFVERPLYAHFVAALQARVRALRVGDPLDPATDQGALVSQQHMEKVLGYIALAQQEGGRLLCGGQRVQVPGRCADGYFVAPTLIEGLSPSCRTNQEEIFGPVATVMPFDHEAQVVQWANSTPYGLSASVWTQHLGRAHRVAAALQAGMVWINCWLLRDLRTPFGGVKSSGVGREGGWEALQFFTESTNVCIKMEPQA